MKTRGSLRDRFRQLEREGRHPILTGIGGGLYRSTRPLRDFLALVAIVPRLRATTDISDPDALVSLVMHEFRRALNPLQIEAEFRQLVRKSAAQGPRKIIEIGTAHGATLFALTRSAASDAIVVSVDLPGGMFGGGYPAWKKMFYRRFARPGQRLHLLRADSHLETTYQKVRGIVGVGEADVLYIDGDHTYEGVRADFERYKDLVRPGGLIFFHDILETTVKSIQVPRFWQEVKGLGLLRNCEEFIGSSDQDGSGVGVGVLVG